MTAQPTRKQVEGADTWATRRAASLLRLLNHRTPGEWKIVDTPDELQFPLAITACLKIGAMNLYVARSGGLRPSRTCRWDVRLWTGDGLILWGSIVFVASAIPQVLRSATQAAVRHDPKIHAPAWCEQAKW